MTSLSLFQLYLFFRSEIKELFYIISLIHRINISIMGGGFTDKKKEGYTGQNLYTLNHAFIFFTTTSLPTWNCPPVKVNV